MRCQSCQKINKGFFFWNSCSSGQDVKKRSSSIQRLKSRKIEQNREISRKTVQTLTETDYHFPAVSFLNVCCSCVELIFLFNIGGPSKLPPQNRTVFFVTRCRQFDFSDFIYAPVNLPPRRDDFWGVLQQQLMICCWTDFTLCL